MTFVEGLSKEQFLADYKTHQAVIMGIVIISELLAKLATEDPGLPERFPQIPWTAIRGLRNRIVHDYYTINLETIFDTAKSGVPELLSALAEAGLDHPFPGDGNE